MVLIATIKGGLICARRSVTSRPLPLPPIFCGGKKATAHHLSHSSTMADSKLRYVRAGKSDFDAILRFTLEHFVRNEPISGAVGLTEQEGMTFIPEMLRKSLEKPTSTKVLNDNDELVAIVLASIAQRHPATDHHSHSDQTADLPENAAKICSFLEHMEEDIWKLVRLGRTAYIQV
uniref:Uncharacterized protein n=1 Tax=Plectus sambesii TaxID=2011161 RepID=A0A914X419_9BILA